MSDADTTGGDDGPEMVQINLRLSEAFLEDIDTTWKEQGFNSRSEFLRYAARDAVKHPEFSREGWKQIAAGEHDLRSGEAELVSREEVVEMMDRDGDDEWRRLNLEVQPASGGPVRLARRARTGPDRLETRRGSRVRVT